MIGLAVGLLVIGFLVRMLWQDLSEPHWYRDSIGRTIIAGVYGAILVIGAGTGGIVELARFIIKG